MVCVFKNFFLVFEIDIISGDGFIFKDDIEFKFGEIFKKIGSEDLFIEIYLVWCYCYGEFVLF